MDRDKDKRNGTSDEVFGSANPPSQGGREGGRLARDIGTQDELKRATERPAGATRVTKSDEKEKGDG